MKRNLLAVLLLAAVVTVQGQSSDATIRITENFYKTPLSKVLNTIEAKCGVKIAYDNTLVQNLFVALKLKNVDINQAMHLLLEDTPLTFHFVGQNIVVVPRPKEEKQPVRKTNFSLSGKVVDSETEETLPQATVRIVGTSLATATNGDGHFAIHNIPADTMILEIRYIGYIARTLALNAIDLNDQVTIKLGSDIQLLNEVVVLDEYNQPLLVEGHAGTAVFNPSALATLPSLGEQDVFRTLQLLPGITATDESSAGMSIRGAHSGYNLTLLDGMTIYQQDHFFGAFSIINSDIIKDVRVQKGLFDAKYGGRISGVVDITSKNGNAVKPAFDIKGNLINVKASAEIPLGKKWSFFGGFRRSLTNMVEPQLFTDLFNIASATNDQVRVFRFTEMLGGESEPKYHFFDSHSKLTFRPSARDNISLSYYVSRDRMRILERTAPPDPDDPLTIETRERTDWGNDGFGLRWGRQWNERYYSILRISNSRFFRNYLMRQQMNTDIQSSNYTFAYDNDIGDFSYASEHEWQPNNVLTVEFGLSGTKQATTIHFWDQYRFSGDSQPDEVPEDTDETESAKSWQHGIFGSASIKFSDKLHTTAGLRAVYYTNETGVIYLEPRLTARYYLTDRFNLKAAYGRNNQFISQLLYVSPRGSTSGLYENFWLLSDAKSEEYPVLNSDHVSGGAMWKGERLVFDTEVYFKQSRRVIIDENFRSGNTNAYGMDFIIQKTTGINKGWIAYSFSHSTQEYFGESNSVPTWQDQRHEIKIVEMLTLGKWTLSSTAIYGSGKPYPRYDVRFNRDENDLIYSYRLVRDTYSDSRLPAYFRLDVAATFQWSIGERVNADVGLSIHNVTDHRNVNMRRIDTQALDAALPSETEPAPIYKDMVLLGFSPTLSMHFSFN